jgi:hypothetical protein
MNSARSAVDNRLLQRVYSEFVEMPGLRLTCRQAQRLWGLDEASCVRVLERLVDAKFLCRPDHGMYMRLTDGRASYPRLRTIKARIDDDRPRTTTKAI